MIRRKPSVASVHNDWLTLVEPVGAFLTIPVLKQVFPNGIPPVDREVRADVRERVDDLGPDLATRTTWLKFVLRDLLGWGDRLREGAAVPVAHHVAERHTTLRADFALVEPQADAADRIRLIGVRWPLRTALDRRPITDERGQPTDWAATPIERAAILCRAANVPLAVVTDTDRFALVWAPAKAPSGYAIWLSSLFIEERLLLDSFVALLGAQRFFGVAESETLEHLLIDSSSAQSEVTNKLGQQVRKAVELLIGAFSRAHRASGLTLLKEVPPGAVYNAAVTVMMRLVVLFAAEERRLLPADDPIYSDSYSVLTARDKLEQEAAASGLETLEKRHSAWHRLLATFRAVHGGIEHERLHLPAYGGSLFDPGRYPFLDSPPIPVDDRTMLAVLDALQILSFRVGGVTEARRLSFKNLDVEQIGNVYEGLLDHGCRRAVDVSVGIIGAKGDEPEIALADLEAQFRLGEDALATWLAEHGGPAPSKTKRLLFEEREPDAEHKLLVACDNDLNVYERVRPFAGLIREDLRGLPMVWLPGSLFVTETSLRRDSGTAYTTKELADEVVHYALEPLVYSPGPAEGVEPGEWKLKSSSDLLRLKVCDPAVGSGAILVAACRYLADRLVEAWQAEAETGTPPRILEGVPDTDWTLVARRVVTDHCLYGVDRNPMALEMAKLSLWLTTMAKDRAFTFLDHQIRSGDSLLGVTSLDQVRWFHIDPERGKALWAEHPLFDPTRAIEARVTAALDRVRELGAIDVITMDDVDRKARLHAAAVALLEPLSVIADGIIGAALAAAGGEDAAEDEDDDEDAGPGRRRRGRRRGRWEARTDRLVESMTDDVQQVFDDSQPDHRREHAVQNVMEKAAFWIDTGRPDLALDRRCLHWPLVFPEVFLATGRTGFDGIVGNPPFLGGQRITGALGTAYRNLLVETLARGKRGSADLVAYFYLRVFDLLNDPGAFGLLATNTIAQGDTREVGLDQLVERGATITRAVPSEPWPGTTSLEVAKVWVRNGPWRGERVLSGASVRAISPMLVIPGRTTGKPYRLKANQGKSFQGSIVLGMGFVMTPQEAEGFVDKDPRNQAVLFPYLNGDDINSRPDQSPSRCVVNFKDWPLDRSADGSWQLADEDTRSEWRRSGSVPKDYPDPVAADFPDCLDIARAKVRPERIKNRYSASARERWWLYERWRPELYATIACMDRVLVVPLVSKHAIFVWVQQGMVYSHALGVVATTSNSVFAMLQSSIHEEWARASGSTLETRMRYTPSDCYETFPFCMDSGDLEQAGLALDAQRRKVLSAVNAGLTVAYNNFHDRKDRSEAVERLRHRQIETDQIVVRNYGWSDINLGHDFHDTPRGVRFSISPAAREEVLDRLLDLNQKRYREEVEHGLHEGATTKKKRTPGKRSKSEASRRWPLLEGA